MQWETLVGGALAGGIVNIIWNYFSKKIDYQIDYKKYIVRKRQESYDILSGFITKLSETQSNGINRIPGVLFPAKRETIVKFNENVNSSFNNNIWFSSEMTSIFLDLSRYSHKLVQEVLPSMNANAIESYCAEQYQIFSEFRTKFQKQLLIDIIELPDIKKFKMKIKDHFPVE